MLERKWFSVRQSFTADGTASGLIIVSDVQGFYVNQTVELSSITQTSPKVYKIDRIEGSTKIYVRDPAMKFGNRADVSAYLLSDSAQIFAPEQQKPVINLTELDQYTYELEPILAKRVVPVDPYGKVYGPNNPMSVIIGSGGTTLTPANFDDVKIVKNSNGDPIQYQFYLANASVGNVDVSYDTFGASEYKKA